MQEITGIFVACQTFTERYKLWYNALNYTIKTRQSQFAAKFGQYLCILAADKVCVPLEIFLNLLYPYKGHRRKCAME